MVEVRSFTKTSHGQKTDKETQSPVLKIFRDMDKKEKRDPEKTNLLNGKNVEKKRKLFLGYRCKSDQKSLESSSSDVQHPYKPQEQELRNTEYHRTQSQSLPFHGSKSWVFWQNENENNSNNKKARTNDDTCSCVSCALKKLIGNDYACVCCLALLLSISVIIACLLVYKCIPTMANTVQKHDSERLKRKIDSINGWGSFMPKTFGGYRNKWHDSSFRDLGVVDADSELARIIDDTKLNEIHSSVRLRDFYKKLLKADSNIRKLKKSSDFPTFDTNLPLDFKPLPEREKRSIHFWKKPFKLFHFKKQKTNETNIEGNKNYNLTKIEKSRQKRHGNNTGETMIIEKDQIMIQYKPRIVPKCSHNIPKVVKPYEHLLKHPFYKNTQRLDDLLDQFNRDLPEIINDQFGLQLHVDDDKSQCKHTKPNVEIKTAAYDINKMVDKPKVITNNKEKLDINNYKTDFDMFRKMRNGNPNMEGAKTNGYADFDGDALKRDDSSTNAYDILLTISTLLNPNLKRTTPYLEQMDRIPNLRRLLQTDGEDDEIINYEDLNEVLTDDNQEHDDDDKQNRKKRLDDFNPNVFNPIKYHPPNVNNPNWKGPMPLYPDEISSMIKQGPIIVNKVRYPVHRDEIKELSDLDYIEDYLDSKYKGLARLAQAYSDYGVLTNKKIAITKKNKMTVKRIKTSPVSLSEGIRFEIQPTSTAREDSTINFYDFFQRHVKVTNDLYKKPTYMYPTVTIPIMEYEPKRYPIFENNNVKFPLFKDKKSIKNLDGSNLHKVPLQYDDNPMSINLNNVKVENRNKKVNRKNKNDLSKHGNNIKIETVNNLNEKVFNENENDDNDKIVFKKRSLKTFDATNNPELNEDSSETTIEKNDSRDDKKSKSEVINDISKENVSLNGTNRSLMELSDFFMMMSNIFSAMDREEVTTEPYNISNNLNSYPSTNPEIKTTDILYPMYDADMIDNIGHRSRVLMSVNSTDGGLGEHEGVFDAETKKLTINATSPILSKNKKISMKNKTARIVKRHAGDNTIFWNDIYDDEYGVKTDVFESIKDKNSAGNEFMKRSNEWIQDKVRRLSDNLHRTTSSEDEKRVGRSVWNSHGNGHRRNSYYNEKNKKLIRRIRNPYETPQSEGRRTDFSALTVHMKDVCRRAATAVRETNESDDNKDDKTDVATTSMMQELVNLMTNLIDFQVQQRTCMKLPPDLNNFLQWLTDVTPSDNVDDTPNDKLYKNEQSEEIRDEKPSSDMPSERDDLDPRSDCLGTLQAIQDLLRSFEDMPDDDKSKMTGVKDYLLNQITYLKKRISDEEFSNNLQYRMDPYRYKRDLAKRRSHHKYVKNYSKKHTKTTVSYYDGVTLNEPFEVMTRKKVKGKRNLRDIYYKALADAKKVTTIKSHHLKLIK